MRRNERFFRWATGLLLLAALCVGGRNGAVPSARAAPQNVGIPGHVVISELRTSGPNGSTDEFIEIFNRTNNPVDITNWKIRKSSGCGTTLTDLVTIGTFSLAAGQRFLVGNSSGYTGIIDQSYTSPLSVADEGGIAIVDEVGTIIDQVGMCSTTTYKEFDSASPSYLSPLSGSADQSYERKNNGCTDSDDNHADFVLQTPSSPQNSSSIPIKCLEVTNVTSTTVNGTYLSGASITITVEFSSNVNVSGAPTLSLETGAIDRTATYTGGSGSSILTFTYVVQAGDVSDDLEYVSSNSLTLNGGSITGAVGDADLALPSPGASGSLGANKAIVIDNLIAPIPISFERHIPFASPTNADTLTFRTTFSEPVTGVGTGDFSVSGSTATVASVTFINSSLYDVQISGGNLNNLNGDVELNLVVSPGITDSAGNPLSTIVPAVSEIYTLDNDVPDVSVEQAAGQADPVSGTPVDFTIVFSEPIVSGTFTTGDITQSGTISSSLITWNISGGPSTFALSATSVAGNGTIIPSITAGRVADPAGNTNTSSTSTDNSVQFTDTIRPTVTVNQAAGQVDPANNFPINFTVVFSEPIIPSIFASTDITQSGTATGVSWSITDSGDHRTFTLSATAATDFGSLIPSIAANRVTDPVGNNNFPSTSTDNTVAYQATPPLAVVINEVAWAGTLANSNDEWIELYNPGPSAIDLSGWMLTSSDGSPDIALSGTLNVGEYYLLERNEDAVVDVSADLTYSGTLSNSGEILRLYDSKNSIIDTANLNGGAWPAGIASTFSSMQRSLISADSDYVWVSYDAASDTGTKSKDASDNDINGTPGRANRPINVTPTVTPNPKTVSANQTATAAPGAAPILGISEFLPRPGHDWNNDGLVDVFDEFIEIINAGTINVDLKGYRLDDEEDLGSSPFTLGSLTLKPGERAVFYAMETDILLSDGGDTVRLLNSRGSVIDAFTYGVVRYPDQSWCRIPDRLGYWNEPCFPTPGNPNALTGTFPVPVSSSTGYDPPLCLLPDTTPDEFVYGECLSSGGGIWNRQYWDGMDLYEKLLLDPALKWDVIIR